MSKLKPLYVYCHYVVNDVEFPVTVMYSEIQTFETDTLLNKIAEKLESRFDHYFQERGELKMNSAALYGKSVRGENVE